MIFSSLRMGESTSQSDREKTHASLYSKMRKEDGDAALDSVPNWGKSIHLKNGVKGENEKRRLYLDRNTRLRKKGGTAR